MKKAFLLLAILLSGGLLLIVGVLLAAISGYRRLSSAQRERLANLPATMMERCMQIMPEDSPPMVMVSSLGRLQEQGEEILAVLREQRDLLRNKPS